MSQHTRHKHPKLEICRDCLGEGLIYTFDKYDLLHQEPLGPYECPTCQGHGRVWVSKIITTTVVPFKNK